VLGSGSRRTIGLVHRHSLRGRPGRGVLRLIAAGKSNRDIADTLFISLNTVATHVRNILTKTGCTNRTEAAACALRHNWQESEGKLIPPRLLS
jgi:DNA-binding CsgD family transcriptional regulator